MIDYKKVNKLLEERKNKLIELIQTPNEDEKNAIKAEIKNIEKRLERILGKKEFDRIEELRNKKGRKEKQAIDNYYEFKSKMSKIEPLYVATRRFIVTSEKVKEIDFSNEKEPDMAIADFSKEDESNIIIADFTKTKEYRGAA